MNQEIKKLWIDALTSGDYQQGRLRLRTVDGRYCCLGVLCDLYRKETGHGEWINEATDPTFECPVPFTPIILREEVVTLPLAVTLWADLPSDSCGTGIIGDLITVNDEHQNSFNDIAKLIESKL
jgi:hypothetical protein